MSAPRDNRAQVIEQASEWMVRLQDPQLPDADLEAWLGWMEASPDHAKAFDDLGHLWNLAGSLTSADVLAARDAAAVARPVAPAAMAHSMATRPTQAPRSRSRRRWLAGVAAGLALMVAGGYLWHRAPAVAPAIEIATDIGERRHVVLEDGSAVDLDASSKVRVSYRADERHLTLLQGRAFFTVAHDPARPFTVAARDVISVALGTRFSVAMGPDDSIAVTVSDGRVQVNQSGEPGSTRRVVERDQRLRALQGKNLSTPLAVDSLLALGWMQGRMTYQDEPLLSVLADINRYSRVPVRLDDPSLGKVKVTGLWDSTRTDYWIEGLASVLGLKVVRGPDSIVLTRPPR